LQASIRFARRDWAGALESADAGLRLDPQDDACTNMRAMALVQLGRRDEAGATIQGALERDPENAVSHANQGWTRLHERRPKEALEHFREALRIDPDLDWARAGLVEALKARHLIYRWMLGFFLWMGRKSAKVQWLVIIGIFLGQRSLGQLADANPALAPFLWPLLILAGAFVLLSWMADPLFNLILRLNRFGRLALRRDQIVASNWLGGCLLVTAGVFVAGLASPQYVLAYASLPCLVVSAAVTGIFRVRSGWPRLLLTVWVIALAFLVVRMSWYVWQAAERAFQGPETRRLLAAFQSDVSLFSTGALSYFIVTNVLMFTRPRRW
jgi:tetratricopeptide (TPR) repeat protein